MKNFRDCFVIRKCRDRIALTYYDWNLNCRIIYLENESNQM